MPCIDGEKGGSSKKSANGPALSATIRDVEVREMAVGGEKEI